MTKRTSLFAVLALALAGCGTTTPVVLDQKMGESVDMALAQQTLNPQASMDTAPVEMIDGKSASALMDRYHKGYEKPTAINIFDLGLGSGTGSTLGPTGSSK